jgi:hypothetical protein
MKRKYILILLLVALFIPVLYVVASTYSVSVNDAFNFVDNVPSILLGLKFSQSFSDAFHLLDATLKITLSTNNVFGSTTTNNQNILIATNTIAGQLATEVAVPITMMFGVIVAGKYLGLKNDEFPILLGLLAFMAGALIYVKILPTWIIVFPILFAGGAVSLLISNFLGSRNSAEG